MVEVLLGVISRVTLLRLLVELGWGIPLRCRRRVPEVIRRWGLSRLGNVLRLLKFGTVRVRLGSIIVRMMIGALMINGPPIGSSVLPIIIALGSSNSFDAWDQLKQIARGRGMGKTCKACATLGVHVREQGIH